MKIINEEFKSSSLERESQLAPDVVFVSWYNLRATLVMMLQEQHLHEWRDDSWLAASQISYFFFSVQISRYRWRQMFQLRVWGQGAMWWWRSTFICVWRRQYEPKVRRTKTAFQSSVRSRRHVMMRRPEASHMEHAGQSSSFFHRRSRHDMFYSGNFICPHAVSLQSFLHIHVLNTGTRPASEWTNLPTCTETETNYTTVRHEDPKLSSRLYQTWVACRL